MNIPNRKEIFIKKKILIFLIFMNFFKVINWILFLSLNKSYTYLKKFIKSIKLRGI